VTWDTLGNDIVMDPIVIANMKRKDRVDEEFRQIKKEVNEINRDTMLF